VEELKKKVAQVKPAEEATVFVSAEEEKVKEKAREKAREKASTSTGDANPAKAKRTTRLHDVLKLEEVEGLDADLLVKMWGEHHLSKEGYVSGFVSADNFQRFRERTRRFNQVSQSLSQSPSCYFHAHSFSCVCV